MQRTTKPKPSRLKIRDLRSFAKSQARLCGADYGGSREAYLMDRNNILRAQRACKKAADLYWSEMLSKTELICGEYFCGRLIITETGLQYIPGQYAPTEIYWALEDYFNKFRTKGGSNA